MSFLVHENYAPKHKAKLINSFVNSECPLQVNASNRHSLNRSAIESFIKKGFSDFYGAQISVSTPYLISLSKGNLKAALGVRSATNTLFIEQYLNKSIETKLAEAGNVFKRAKIAEIAHLFSNARVFTLPLLLVTATSLKFKGFEVMAFTGTAHIIGLIEKTGIEVHKVAQADPRLLTISADSWGSYYDSKPTVAYIKLCDVLRVIETTPKLAYMFAELMPQVANVVTQMADL